MEDSESVRSDIILIGPIRAGKTTLGELLAQRLHVPNISLDSMCWDYYREIHIDRQVKRGPDGMIASRFNVHAVQRLLKDYQNCVFDFGAGHSVYREAEALGQVQEALASYPNVFLLLPCPDMEEAARVLEARNANNSWLHRFREENLYDPNAHFLRHASNYILAKHTVYTEGRSPEQTATEILSLASRKA